MVIYHMDYFLLLSQIWKMKMLQILSNRGIPGNIFRIVVLR
jgi:hypothetical protein